VHAARSVAGPRPGAAAGPRCGVGIGDNIGAEQRSTTPRGPARAAQSELMLALLLLAVVSLAVAFAAAAACPGGLFNSTCEPNSDCKAPACVVLSSFHCTDSQQCCAACVAAEGCAAWTLNIHGQKCWLRSAATARLPGNCLTGELVPRPPPPPPRPPPPPPPLPPAPSPHPPSPGPPLPGAAQQPHIALILADDLGWNDVSFHGGGQIPTPHIDQLAARGMRLSNYYVQPVCSPTRSCILSGRHVIHSGIYNPFGHGTVGALSKSFTLLPEYLKRAGYFTKMVRCCIHDTCPALGYRLRRGAWICPNLDLAGWQMVCCRQCTIPLTCHLLKARVDILLFRRHLGMFNWSYVPSMRGFDEYYGYHL
jgi:hypothetical protein